MVGNEPMTPPSTPGGEPARTDALVRSNEAPSTASCAETATATDELRRALAVERQAFSIDATQPRRSANNPCNQALPGIHHFCIFARPMTRIGLRAGPPAARSSRSSAARSSGPVARALLLALSLGAAVLATGCDELQARKAVQEGNFEYREGRFEEAKVLFEKALTLEPKLEIASHNLGLTCAKLVKAGDESPENAALADCATKHIQAYIARHPKENKLRDKMTSIWLNNRQYDKALAYWLEQMNVIPPDEGAQAQKREIALRVAGIYFKDKKWREAIEWFNKAAEFAVDDNGKVNAYQAIGNVSWAVMRDREKNYGAERIEAADAGLSALEKAASLDPKKPEIRALIAALYNFRALAQGSVWAASIERATAQDHDRRRRVLSEEAKKAQAAAAAAAPATSTGQGK